MSPDWGAVRAEFPALREWTYLNTATFGQLPRRSAEAVARHFAARDELACSNFLSWFGEADAIRASVARLVHCAADDIAFIPNACSGLSLLLGGINWKQGDRIVTLKDEFPNNIYHPALMANCGIEFVETCWDGFYDAVTPRTRVVAISTVNYTNGFRPPLEEAAKFLRERGVILFLDGTQSVGALEFDASAIQPEMLAVNGYKWLLSPNGAGFLYVRPDFRDRLNPIVVGWRSHKTWRDVDNLHHGAPEFSEAAEKYEGGMLGFPALYGMWASVEMMLEIGPAEIEKRVQDLAGKTRALLRGLGAHLMFDEAPHFDSPVIAARFEGRNVSELAVKLKERKVLVSARHGNLRVSTHFYNDENDLDRFENQLKSML